MQHLNIGGRPLRLGIFDSSDHDRATLNALGLSSDHFETPAPSPHAERISSTSHDTAPKPRIAEASKTRAALNQIVLAQLRRAATGAPPPPQPLSPHVGISQAPAPRHTLPPSLRCSRALGGIASVLTKWIGVEHNAAQLSSSEEAARSSLITAVHSHLDLHCTSMLQAEEFLRRSEIGPHPESVRASPIALEARLRSWAAVLEALHSSLKPPLERGGTTASPFCLNDIIGALTLSIERADAVEDDSPGPYRDSDEAALLLASAPRASTVLRGCLAAVLSPLCSGISSGGGKSRFAFINDIYSSGTSAERGREERSTTALFGSAYDLPFLREVREHLRGASVDAALLHSNLPDFGVETVRHAAALTVPSCDGDVAIAEAAAAHSSSAAAAALADVCGRGMAQEVARCAPPRAPKPGSDALLDWVQLQPRDDRAEFTALTAQCFMALQRHVRAQQPASSVDTVPTRGEGRARQQQQQQYYQHHHQHHQHQGHHRARRRRRQSESLAGIFEAVSVDATAALPKSQPRRHSWAVARAENTRIVADRVSHQQPLPPQQGPISSIAFRETSVDEPVSTVGLLHLGGSNTGLFSPALVVLPQLQTDLAHRASCEVLLQAPSDVAHSLFDARCDHSTHPSTRHDGSHSCTHPRTRQLPFSEALRRASCAQLIAGVRSSHAAAVAGMLFHGDLAAHLSAIRAWVLMGPGAAAVWAGATSALFQALSTLADDAEVPATRVVALAMRELRRATAEHGMEAAAQSVRHLSSRFLLEPAFSACATRAARMATRTSAAAAGCLSFSYTPSSTLFSSAPQSTASVTPHQSTAVVAASSVLATDVLRAAYSVGEGTLAHAVLHSDASRARYAAVHALLLRLRRAMWELDNSWRSRVRDGHNDRDAFVLRHAMSTAVCGIHAFVMESIHTCAWPALLRALAAACAAAVGVEGGGDCGNCGGSVGALRRVHDSFTAALVSACLLPDPGGAGPAAAAGGIREGPSMGAAVTDGTSSAALSAGSDLINALLDGALVLARLMASRGDVRERVQAAAQAFARQSRALQTALRSVAVSTTAMQELANALM